MWARARVTTATDTATDTTKANKTEGRTNTNTSMPDTAQQESTPSATTKPHPLAFATAF